MAADRPRTTTYLLGESALEEFLASSDRWRSWRTNRGINEPNGLFVTAATFGSAKLDHVAASLAGEDPEIAEQADDKFQILQSGAFAKRILPITAEVWQNALDAFRQIEEHFRTPEPEGGSIEWDLDINSLIEFGAAMHWNMTLVSSAGTGDQEHLLLRELKSANPQFSYEIIE